MTEKREITIILEEIREAIQENKEIQQIACNNLRKWRQLEQVAIEIINKQKKENHK